MGLPADLVAFFKEHRSCGDLDGGVEGDLVWMACDCGGQLARHSMSRPKPPHDGCQRPIAPTDVASPRPDVADRRGLAHAALLEVAYRPRSLKLLRLDLCAYDMGSVEGKG
jgi:hypothetical protein